jgi:tetratricopeptide (TPR) repeat protein
MPSHCAGWADSQLDAGNLTAARRHYEALAKRVPNDGEALNNLAFVMIQQKDAAALATAERALASNPNAPHFGTAGWAAWHAGQKERAVQLLRDPGCATGKR